jgi:hypothetical protein
MLYPVMLILLAMAWRRVCGEVLVDFHLAVCSGWCFQIPLMGLLFVVWSWPVSQLASDSGDDEEMPACLWLMRSTNLQYTLGVFFMAP